MRTLTSETLTKIGQEVTLKGWVNTVRSHGKVTFIDLRDRAGIVQTVSINNPQAKGIGAEDVVEVKGMVKTRPEKLINPKIITGTIEVEIRELKQLSRASELPLPIDTDGYSIEEEIRLKYRYLDLRRPRLTKNIRLRSQFIDLIRQYLFKNDFCEIETPMLTKSTPEGSRDFLVPSRMQPGKFYALPQSPQQYKQLLMVAGFERYFQIARCMRDEDLRADRGFEHTQIDIEMSFVTREDVMMLDESMITSVVEQLGYKIKQKPFPIFTYAQAMEKFGADKFDLRSEGEKKNGVLAYAWVVDFPFFEKTDAGAWTFTHNPFSAPKPQHKDWLLSKDHIGDILTSQYDLVCNGLEVGGGSIRGHEPEILKTVFEIMGYTIDEIEKQFGHMLKAFTFGTPPHGGLAHGIERNLMVLLEEKYLREVVAFPMTSGGQTAVMEAPAAITDEQLREVGLSLRNKNRTGNVYSQIIEMLSEYKCVYKTYDHKSVFTSEEAADVRGTSLHQGAKALIMMGDGIPLMFVLPADLKVNTKHIKQTLKIKDLRMATKEEVKRTTGVEVGAVPPFGNLFGISLYVDEALRDNKIIAFNAGSHTQSISMKESDFEKIVRPTIGNFSLKS